MRCYISILNIRIEAQKHLTVLENWLAKLLRLRDIIKLKGGTKPELQTHPDVQDTR